MLAYCLKCKNKTEMTNTSNSMTSNGKKVLKGNCTVCNTKMNKFLKSS